MAKAPSKISNIAVKHATLGFGVPATSDPHHFKIIIPKSNNGQVQINEYLGLQAQRDEFAMIERVLLDRSRWNAIRSEVQRTFNVRLKSYGLNTSTWQVGENIVDRLLGKELCVLAWAIEGMDIENIPVAVRNWLALVPEERWWLFGMTARSTGSAEDSDVGWRIALRHALGDIVQTEQVEFSQRKDANYSREVTQAQDIEETSEAYSEKQLKNGSSLLLQVASENNYPLQPLAPERTKLDQDDLAIDEENLFLFEAKHAKAIGLPVGNKNSPEFLVKKGSTANIAIAKSLRPTIRDLRQQILEQGILVKQGEVYSFSQDYLFKSPSAAACVIAGNPRSGMDAWKDLRGHSLKNLGYGKKPD